MREISDALTEPAWVDRAVLQRIRGDAPRGRIRLLLVDLLAVLSKDELVHAGHGEGQHATFSGAAVGLVARFVFDPRFGLLQDLLHRTGIDVPDFYQNPQWALFMVTVNHGCGAGWRVDHLGS
jgi:hypothetical protein